MSTGFAFTAASLLGTWAGKKIVTPLSEGIFVIVVEVGLLAAGLLFLIGL
ncbi:hypothetical protein GCM10023321_59040 [Pseudonocardia eucalypti]|uniref:GDT1 family protein n=1 Tax=Pseudonocardia eucalypti TaxID=648755 RepID=A0ABP9QTL5_9PSEU|nr:hypothetical protein [Pseudonocardia eucalypti]